jgi:hypothetical protein
MRAFLLATVAVLGYCVFTQSNNSNISIPIPFTKQDQQHLTSIQLAKCQMRADAVYKTSDKTNIVLPQYVSDCMLVNGYDFFVATNSICSQDFDDAIKAQQIGQLGGYSTEQDPECYVKH